MLFRFVDVMDLVLCLCYPFLIQGRETYQGDFLAIKLLVFAFVLTFTDRYLLN